MANRLWWYCMAQVQMTCLRDEVLYRTQMFRCVYDDAGIINPLFQSKPTFKQSQPGACKSMKAGFYLRPDLSNAQKFFFTSIRTTCA